MEIQDSAAYSKNPPVVQIGSHFAYDGGDSSSNSEVHRDNKHLIDWAVSDTRSTSWNGLAYSSAFVFNNELYGKRTPIVAGTPVVFSPVSQGSGSWAGQNTQS